jgi:membrane protease subunit HflK
VSRKNSIPSRKKPPASSSATTTAKNVYYAEATVAEAKGQASRFSQVYEQYNKAPDVTRKRIYLETMERVLGGTDKTIIDTGGQSSPGVVPYLPLTSLPRERATQQQQPAGGNQ